MKKQSTTFQVFLTLVLLSGCTVTLLAPYDQITDTKTAELHESVLLQLNRLNAIYELNADSSVLTYKENFDFYNVSITKTELLLSRNKGIEKNEIIVKQLQGLLENLEDLKDIHQEDVILQPVDLQSFKTIFDVQLGAIQKFQQVRRQSNKSSEK